MGAFTLRAASTAPVLILENAFTAPGENAVARLASMWISDFAARQDGRPRVRCVSWSPAVAARQVQVGGWTEVPRPAHHRGGVDLLEQRATIMALLNQWVRTERLPHLSSPSEAEVQPPLHPHHVRIARLYAQGLTTPEVAGRLFLSVDTVKSHTAQARRLTAVRSTTALVQDLYLRGELARGVSSGVNAAVSPRQRAVLGFTAFGDPQAAIGMAIGVSLEVVKADLSALRSAFDARTNHHLVARGWDEGFLC
ncbi:LuxR C-terminal-related transcriptional regulator [Streptomyces virginiae]|uniref:helix-turn-helix transcriptional regulator n=1 Tax=Streptomyces virginiae TaxID=1961 RepID=UPI0036FB2D9F